MSRLRKSESSVEVSLYDLSSWFSKFGSALVALSGGVDSSVLACVARRTLGKANCVAVTSVSPSFTEGELFEAKRIAHEIDIELVVVQQDDLASRGYVANGVNRCYFCRSNLVEAAMKIAKDRDVGVCVDGTHIDDLKSPRPGIRALREGGFRAPFAEIGFTKKKIRDIARVLELSNAEKPSESCLSSRVAYGQILDFDILHMIELAEIIVREQTGAKVVRVRTTGKSASVEVDSSSVKVAQERFASIESALKAIGYEWVRIDPTGYTPGKMLSLYVGNEAE